MGYNIRSYPCDNLSITWGGEMIEARNKSIGMAFQQFLEFIGRIKSGETAVIISPDFIVMGEEHYKQITNEPHEVVTTIHTPHNNTSKNQKAK